MSSQDATELPPSNCPSLHLTHPTPSECVQIWTLTHHAWGDALTLPQYLQESQYLTTVPLARNSGMATWILVDSVLPPDQRSILSSCETFHKRSFISTSDGEVRDVIIHGVASVYCNDKYRGRGYAARMMMDLKEVLRNWQTERGTVVGSVLYSDIGKKFYAALGWHPFPNNSHVEFKSSRFSKRPEVRHLFSEDLEQLCKEDEALMRKFLAQNSGGKIRMMIVPNIDHMQWHHAKESFVTNTLFSNSKMPLIKGAIVGSRGSRIWAIWTHRFYSLPSSPSSDNTLYILRLVIESQSSFATPSHPITNQGPKLEFEQVSQMKAVLESALTEAAEWNLPLIKLWDPTPFAQELIARTEIEHCKVVREEEGIASLLWHGEGSGEEDTLEWLVNEKYAWC